MRGTRIFSQLRVFAAAIAAAITVLICIAQRHVRIVLYEPRTYTSPFRHKCGLLMVGCVIWATLELKRHLSGATAPADGRSEA